VASPSHDRGRSSPSRVRRARSGPSPLASAALATQHGRMPETNATTTATAGPGALAVGPALPTLDADAHVLAPLLSFAHEAPDRPIFAVRDGAGYRDVPSAEFV